MKLKDVYITWEKKRVKVVAKELGIPEDAENFFDPDLWDQSDLAHLFAQWFTTLTIGHWEVMRADSPSQVYDALMKIEEFNELMETRILRKEECDDLGEGDMETTVMREHGDAFKIADALMEEEEKAERRRKLTVVT